MSVDSSPWLLPHLPSNEDDPERGTPRGSSPPLAPPSAAIDAEREQLLNSLHQEAATLRTAARLGDLSSSERDYLDDLQQEIDHHESFRPSLREGDLWKRIDALAERVLASNDE